MATPKALNLLVIAGPRCNYVRLFENARVPSDEQASQGHHTSSPTPVLPLGKVETLKKKRKSGRKADSHRTNKNKPSPPVRGSKVVVEQCSWEDLSVVSFARGGLVVSILPSRRPLEGTSQNKARVFHPDFVLFRAGCKGGPRLDWMHKLDPFCHADVPAVNSWESFYFSQDKAAMYGRLTRVMRRQGGFESFPLVPQACYSDWRASTFPPDTPCVAKVGTASGGMGKMKIDSPGIWEDFCSCANMQMQFYTSEPFYSWIYDVRVQKIGSHHRAFKRQSKHWKSNVDIAMKDEDVYPVPERWIRWIELAAAECGMDICAMDILQMEDGSEVILELNSSAIGLNARHAAEDEQAIKEIVLDRMYSVFCNSKIEAGEAPRGCEERVDGTKHKAHHRKREKASKSGREKRKEKVKPVA